jgi:hypothetical protein
MPTLVSLVFLRGSRSELVGSQRGANANVPVRCITRGFATEPTSVPGTFRKWRDVLYVGVFGRKAEVA